MVPFCTQPNLLICTRENPSPSRLRKRDDIYRLRTFGDAASRCARRIEGQPAQLRTRESLPAHLRWETINSLCSREETLYSVAHSKKATGGGVWRPRLHHPPSTIPVLGRNFSFHLFILFCRGARKCLATVSRQSRDIPTTSGPPAGPSAGLLQGA